MDRGFRINEVIRAQSALLTNPDPDEIKDAEDEDPEDQAAKDENEDA